MTDSFKARTMLKVAVDIQRLERIETQYLVLLVRHLEHRSGLEAIRHDPSTEK
jgi:hypothetical protein